MLGLYVSDHPLLGVEAALRRKVDCSVAEATERDDGAVVVIGGVITGMTRKFTKKGAQMAVFMLEDLDAAIEVTVFPRTLEEQGYKMVDDAIVTVRGRIDRRDEARLGFMAQDVTVLEGLDTASTPPLRLKLPPSSLNDIKIHQLRKILREHPGESLVFLHLGTKQVLQLADEFSVDLDRVIGELRVAFGHDAVML
jgi:DNA polymerase-3 subunit alpha